MRGAYKLPEYDVWASMRRRCLSPKRIAPCDPHVEPAQKPRLSGQNAWLADRLRRGPITPMQALAEHGIMRLAARVGDLKAHGYQIETRRIDKGVTEYSLIEGGAK